MNKPAKRSDRIVISASRRTDIPAFYLPWFMQSIDRGFFNVVNPYNRRVTVVPASPEKIHTIVFWSKNFSRFLDENIGPQLIQAGYNLFFNFTINSAIRLLEPRVPPLDERLEQLKRLCQSFDPRSVNWRFDPICHFQTSDGKMRDNLSSFEMIAAHAARCGIRRCITSFRDDYAKIRKRIKAIPGFAFTDPPLEQKKAILLSMETTLAKYNMRLYTCCEKQVSEILPSESSIRPGSCIPNDLLADLFGGRLSLRKDSGQRVQAGCGCKLSADIGSYHLHPCFHNCLFCYANPSGTTQTRPI